MSETLDDVRRRADAATAGPWFVGTMNDCNFIIDRKPRPAPVDYVNPDALPSKIWR